MTSTTASAPDRPGHAAARTTCCVVDPKSASPTPSRPCAPMTMRSACLAPATPRISRWARPIATASSARTTLGLPGCGSTAVVRSWLLDLLGRALKKEGNSHEHIADYVDDSGTGRWAVEYALAQGIPVPGISVTLYERFDSRVQKRFAHQVIAALRKQFGGHAVREG